MATKLHFEKKIFDSVCGFIGLTPCELRIVDTSLFQRLHYIKQNGFAYLVFPGAVHDRFCHSLGVMHFADKMATHLLQTEEGIGINREKVRLAALLHDIGHYPFSHTTERVYINEAKRLLEPKIEDREVEVPGMTKDDELPFLQTGKRGTHEYMSALVVTKTEISEILEEFGFDSTEIAQMITCAHPEPIMNQIISSELDADRIDYLTRDAKFVGVQYGAVEADQLIRNIRWIRDEGLIGINEKRKRVAEHFIISRYFMYSEILYHKVVYGFGYIGERVYEGLRERNLVLGLDDLMSALKEPNQMLTYVFFDDRYFLNKLQEIHSDSEMITNVDDENLSVKNDRLLSLAEMLLFRTPLPLVWEETNMRDRDITPTYTNEFAILRDTVTGSKAKDTADKAGIPDEWLIPLELRVSPTEMSPYGQTDSEGQLHNLYVTRDGKKGSPLVKDPTSLLSVLGSKRLEILRVHTHPDYEDKLESYLQTVMPSESEDSS